MATAGITVLHECYLKPRDRWSTDRLDLLDPELDVRNVLDITGTPNVIIRFFGGRELSLLQICVITENFDDAAYLLQCGASVD